MPLTKLEWSRLDRAYGFNQLSALNFAPVTPGAGVANTTPQAWIPLPTSFKVSKVAISFAAVNSLSGGHLVNVVYNTIATPNSGGSEGSVASNDNSYATSGTNFGWGVPTNGAADGNPLFSADIALNTTNFPGATTSNGGVAVFIPTNYDAVYPSGPVPSLTSPGTINQVAGYFTVRVVTPASTGSITSLVVTLLGEPVTLKASWATPGQASPVTYCTPGQDF